jgi:hypothetical protein
MAGRVALAVITVTQERAWLTAPVVKLHNRVDAEGEE